MPEVAPDNSYDALRSASGVTRLWRQKIELCSELVETAAEFRCVPLAYCLVEFLRRSALIRALVEDETIHMAAPRDKSSKASDI